MKPLFILSILFICLHSVTGQEEVLRLIRHDVDSILHQVEKESNKANYIIHIQNIYKTRVESYPIQILETAQKLYEISQAKKDIFLESCAWSFYGQAYRLSGNYTKGLECHHKAVSLAEQDGDHSLLAIAQNQMAHIYKDREENEKALRLYTSSKVNALKGKNEETIIWPMMNLGAVFLAMNQLDSSLYYSMQTFERGSKFDVLPRYLPYILMNIGSAYSKIGNNDEAKTYFDKALIEASKNASPRYNNLVYVALAEHYLRNNDQDSSAFFAKKAIEAVQNTVFTFLNIKPSKLLTDIYEKTNADSTLKYLRIFRAANDSLFNARAEQQLQVMTFEEEQRQQEIATEKINYRNKIKMNMMMGGLGTFLLIVLILFRNNKQKQKANALLHHQKKEIEKTLSQLKTTQAQLVQSEKMASLGELTAGIAHEIQNPLNFVNNFSEVNAELIDELKDELTTGNWQQANEIATNIKENEEKIIFHGKRADAIVKGMLQHSRSSSGIKEPTDINALCDEYLRLAYHGLRAKDKTFNASMKTDFDSSIGLVNIVPQDIGRVILNLITNAFHAVSEKHKALQTPYPLKGGVDYEPIVTVKTKKQLPLSGGRGSNGSGVEQGSWIEISVSDNGPGIPSHILDKIFQPFFTTKPTGQGTGLGLSLSYDIVKAHDGELKVETKEGEGSSFAIILPT